MSDLPPEREGGQRAPCTFGESAERGADSPNLPTSRRLFPGFEEDDSRPAPLLEFFFF